MTISQLVAVIGLTLLAIVAVAAYFFRAEIAYNLRLLNAKLVADRFYADAPGITKNIGYGRGDREKLDVYQPTAPGTYPVLIWVHGGSWTSGNKELYAPVARAVLPENIVVVIPNYTIEKPRGLRVGETPLAFQQAQEIADAFAWARENIALFDGDPNRITLGGHSAGAHLTGLVVLDPTYLAVRNHSPHEICAWYGISGPYSIPAQLDYERNVKHRDPALLFEVFGAESNFERGSPQSFVHADTPPILLIHGDADETVPVSVARNFQTALQQVGARSELKIYPNAGHSGILFDALAQDKPQLVRDMVTFAKSCPPIADRK